MIAVTSTTPMSRTTAPWKFPRINQAGSASRGPEVGFESFPDIDGGIVADFFYLLTFTSNGSQRRVVSDCQMICWKGAG